MFLIILYAGFGAHFRTDHSGHPVGVRSRNCSREWLQGAQYQRRFRVLRPSLAPATLHVLIVARQPALPLWRLCIAAFFITTLVHYFIAAISSIIITDEIH